MTFQSISPPYRPAGRPGAPFGPLLRSLAPSAVLAALLISFSMVRAPIIGMQVTSWGATLAYLYYMLCRATYLYSNVCSASPTNEKEAVKTAARAFATALAAHRRGILVGCGILFGACALADVAFLSRELGERDSIQRHIVEIGLVVWFLAAPGLYLSWAMWAHEGKLSFARGFTALAVRPGRAALAWIATVLGMTVISFLFARLADTPVVRDIALGGVIGQVVIRLLMAALIAIQVLVQAVFAERLRRDLAQSPTSPDRADERFARFGIERRRGATIVDLSQRLTNIERAKWPVRFMGAGIILFAAWIGVSEMLSVTVDARLVASQPVCKVRWDTLYGFGRTRHHDAVMACRDTGTFIAADVQRARAEVTESQRLTLAYPPPKGGPEVTFEPVVPNAVALPLIAAGHAMIEDRPFMPPVLRTGATPSRWPAS